jgi:hypothetical protein
VFRVYSADYKGNNASVTKVKMQPPLGKNAFDIMTDIFALHAENL